MWRSENVQTLRGFACLLVVSFHLIGRDGSAGLRVADHSIWHAFTVLFEPIRMPLFTFLSGFVYAYRPVRVGHYREFCAKKLLRLILPMATVSSLFFLLQYLTPGVNHPPSLARMPMIYVAPYAHYWFLQALCLIFALIAILERLQLLERPREFMVVFAAALVGHFLVHVDSRLFSANRALYLLPFFLIGLATQRFREPLSQPRVVGAAALLFLPVMTIHSLAAFELYGDPAQARTLFATTLSMTGLLTLFHFFPRMPLLVRIGGYSFSIYLFHAFFTAAARLALRAVGKFEVWEHVVIGSVAGIVGPIAIEWIIAPRPLLALALLGKSASKPSPGLAIAPAVVPGPVTVRPIDR